MESNRHCIPILQIRHFLSIKIHKTNPYRVSVLSQGTLQIRIRFVGKGHSYPWNKQTNTTHRINKKTPRRKPCSCVISSRAKQNIPHSQNDSKSNDKAFIETKVNPTPPRNLRIGAIDHSSFTLQWDDSIFDGGLGFTTEFLVPRLRSCVCFLAFHSGFSIWVSWYVSRPINQLN